MNQETEADDLHEARLRVTSLVEALNPQRERSSVISQQSGESSKYRKLKINQKKLRSTRKLKRS